MMICKETRPGVNVITLAAAMSLFAPSGYLPMAKGTRIPPPWLSFSEHLIHNYHSRTGRTVLISFMVLSV